MRRLPPLNALRSFEAAGRLNSLTLAAAALNVTQSAVAQQIRQLETFLGQKLFERDGRTIRLTVRGRHYWTDVCACLGRLADATQRMTDETASGSVRVNASTSFVHTWLLPQLHHFRERFPAIAVDISATPDDQVAQLDDASDIVIRRYTPELRRQGFVCTPLMRSEAVAVCAPGHAALAGLDTPADLLRAAMLSASASPNALALLHYAGMPQAWQYWFHQAKVDVGETLPGPFFDEFLLALRAAECGLGVCLAPVAVVRDALAGGRLVALFDDNVHLEGPAYHGLHQPTDDAPHLATFIDWLTQQVDPRDRPTANA